MKKTLTMFFLIPLCMLSTFTLIYIVSMDEPLFFLKNVRISGVSQLGERDIMDKISPYLKESLLKVDALKLKEAIGSHPFIREVSIKRVYPFSIVIDVKEKKPSALWVDGDGNITVLDETGTPYRGLAKRTRRTCSSSAPGTAAT